MRAEYLECAKIINTHGIGGALKLESWCDSAAVLAGLDTVYLKKGGEFIPIRVSRASVFKNYVLAHLEGVDSVEDAEAMRGTLLYAARCDIVIDEGAHFIADLIGLNVIDAESGRIYGQLTNVINGGASDIYVVKCDDGEKMMPAVSEFVKRINLDEGIFISPIEGMF